MQTLSKAIKGKENRFISILSFFTKLAVVAFACIFIYNKLFVKQDFASLIVHYEKLLTVVPFMLILVVIILMFINWGFEALKWKFILRKFEDITLLKAFQSVLSGITVSIAAPNRTGEFAGRVFHLEKIAKGQAAMLAIITSYSQLSVTILSGVLAASFLAIFYPGLLSASHTGLIPVALSIAALFVFLYFKVNKIHFLLQLKIFRKYISFFNILKKLGTVDFLKIFILSLTRYLIFSLQFYIMLIVSGANIDFTAGMALISIVYFVMTFIPTTIISELPVRGSVAVAVIGLISDNHLAIANASFVLWIINLMIPALLGTVFFFKVKLFKSAAIA